MGSLLRWAARKDLSFNGRGKSCEGDIWLNHTSQQALLPEMSVLITIFLCSKASCSLFLGAERTTENSKGKSAIHTRGRHIAGGLGWGWAGCGGCAFRCFVCQAEILTLRLWRTLGSTPTNELGLRGRYQGAAIKGNGFSIQLLCPHKHSWLSCSLIK